MRVPHLALLLLLFPMGAFAASSEIEPLGLRVQDAVDPKGLLVTAVQTGSTAYFAGFQPGDLIVAIDKVHLEAAGLSARIDYFKPGDQLGVTWRFVVDGQLSDEPIRTALMVGVPWTGAWMSQVELGPLVGTPYNSTHPYRDIRWYERFEWPNRRPMAGLPEAIQKAITAFPPLLEQAEAKITSLSCKTGVPQAAVNETILKLSQELTISYYAAHGMIETHYDTALRKTHSEACKAACAANPKNPWTVASSSGGKDSKPNACQILLSFDKFLSEVWKRVWRAPRDCSAVREEGCTFSFAGRTTQVRIAKFGKVACRGADHECDFSYELECRGTVNGVYDPILGSPIVCGSLGVDPVGTLTTNFSAGSDGQWSLIPLSEPKGNKFLGQTRDIDELCPLVVEAMRCDRQ
jgi:hypothetical protein